jgi:23S rRNA (cytosine1962-C5)-methyltransferase
VSPESPDRTIRQAEYFANRLEKNERSLRRWARREDVHALRLYDVDIPEIPLAVDRYGDGDLTALHIALYERPYYKDPDEEAVWLGAMAEAAGLRLGVASRQIFLKTRRRMRGLEQYGRQTAGKEKTGTEFVVRESGLDFLVNLGDYLDTGLFLDHRPARSMVRSWSSGKRVLNVFSYTGSFSVYAASGGAVRVSSVDLSNTYLDWAQRNFSLNGINPAAHDFIRADVPAFLADAYRAGMSWDLVVADPPTFSNSTMAANDFNAIRDWPNLLRDCARVLSPGGKILFSTNARSLKWDGALSPLPWKDISAESIPPDFRDGRIHRCWIIGG